MIGKRRSSSNIYIYIRIDIMKVRPSRVRRRLLVWWVVATAFADDVVVPQLRKYNAATAGGDDENDHDDDDYDNDDDTTTGYTATLLPQHHVLNRTPHTTNVAAATMPDDHGQFHRNYYGLPSHDDDDDDDVPEEWWEQQPQQRQVWRTPLLLLSSTSSLNYNATTATTTATTTTTNNNKNNNKNMITKGRGTMNGNDNDHYSDREKSTTAIITNNKTTTTTTTETAPPPELPKQQQQQQQQRAPPHVDYAAKSAGAVILDSSPNSFQGVSHLLQQDRDKYAIVPCGGGNDVATTTTSASSSTKYVVIGLSEDILVKQFAIANYERYSSHMKEIRLFGSVSTNAIRQPSHWIHLGDFTAQRNTHQNEKQTFDLVEPTWARYLKVEFISHYGDEYYCTISQISVHGSTVLQGFHEQWNEENHQENLVRPTEPTKATLSTTTNGGRGEHNTATADDDDDDETGVVDHQQRPEHSNDERVETTVDVASFSTTTTVPTKSRYNFSRIAGSCRSSLSFEENLMYYTSHNENISDHEHSLSSSSSTSRPLRSSSFTNLCATTAKTAMVPSKRSVRKVQVRHSPRTPDQSNVWSRNSVAASNLRPSRQLSHLSLSLERVTDFLRSAMEGFQNKNHDHSTTTSPLSHINDSEISAANKEKDETSVVSDGINNVVTEPDVNAKGNNGNEDFMANSGVVLAKLLKHLPSAKCLEDLNFADFKSQKSTLSKPRNGSNGGPQSSGGGSSGGNGNSNAATSMEPIFKKLSDEIKSLQSNLMMHDQFAKDSVSCYQRVMLDMLLEMESDRRSFHARMTKLEDAIHLTTFLVATQRLASQMFTSAWHYLNSLILLFLRMNQSTVTENFETVGSFANLVFLGAIVVLTYTIAVFRRRYRKATFTNKQNEINIGKGNTISFQYANHNTVDDDDDSSAEILPLSPVDQQASMLDKGTAIAEQ